MALRPRKPATALGRGFEAGLEFTLAVLIGVGIGYWLDSKLDTSPWLMLLFLGFGFAAGFRQLLRSLGATGADGPRGANGSDPPDPPDPRGGTTGGAAGR